MLSEMNDKILSVLNSFLDKVDYASFFRISISFLAITSYFSYGGKEFHALFAGGVLPIQLINLITDGKESGAFYLYSHLSKWFNDYNLFNFVSTVYIVALFFLMVGLLSNFFAFIAFVANIVIYFNSDIFLYGYDIFLFNSLLLCSLCRVSSKLSIDARFLDAPTSIYLKHFLRITLCVCYLFSGLSKAFDGIGWWNGDKMIYGMYFGASQKGIAIANFFVNHRIIPVTLGIGTVILEMLYPVFISLRKTRLITLILVILMHILIVFFMDLLSFSIVMIIWNIAAFYDFKDK